MADRIAVLNGGQIEQFGTPVELFQRPANKFVATFIGSPRMNTFAGSIAGISEAGVELAIPGFDKVTLKVDAGLLATGAPVEIGIRPQHLRLGESPIRTTLKIDYAESIGTETYAYGQIEGAGTETILHLPEHRHFEPGEIVPVGVAPETVHVFDSATGRTLPAIGVH